MGAYDRGNNELQRKLGAREEATHLKDRAQWIPKHEPIEVLAARKKVASQDRRYKRSQGCTKYLGSKLESWCRGVRELDVQIASAMAAERQQKKIKDNLTIARSISRSTTDYQVETIHGYTGWDRKTVLFLLTALTVLLIEGGSTLGPTIAMGLLVPPKTALGRAIGQAISVVTRHPPTPPAAKDFAAAVGAQGPPSNVIAHPSKVGAPPVVPRPSEPSAVKPESAGQKKKRPADRISPVTLARPQIVA